MDIEEIAQALKHENKNIQVLYAFNSTGKTRLSLAYKDATKSSEGQHAGVYYNAHSEDLFSWDNGDGNPDGEIRLNVREGSLNVHHGLMNEDNIRDHLRRFNPTYKLQMMFHEDSERGINYIRFYRADEDPDTAEPIKISRGEERTFIWCFFLALFSLEDLANAQPEHFFIDDPVSSMDDHNIFISASTIIDLIEDHFENRKIIITTHHVGLFTILYDWLKKGEKARRYENHIKLCVLAEKNGDLSLKNCNNDVFLYHLRLMQVLWRARDEDDLRSFHLALLRQVLENVSSFLGVGRISFVLTQIGVNDPDRVASIVNSLSHKTVYYYETDDLVPDNERIISEVLDKLKSKYNFVLHG